MLQSAGILQPGCSLCLVLLQDSILNLTEISVLSWVLHSAGFNSRKWLEVIAGAVRTLHQAFVGVFLRMCYALW